MSLAHWFKQNPSSLLGNGILMGFRSRVGSLCIRHGKQSLHDSLSPILMVNQDLRPLALTRVLVLAPFHITDEIITMAREEGQPPSLKLRKEEGRWAQTPQSPIPHNLLLALLPLLAALPIPFPQADWLLIHPIALCRKIFFFLFPGLNIERHEEPRDITWGRRQSSSRQKGRGRLRLGTTTSPSLNHHISQFKPPHLPI